MTGEPAETFRPGPAAGGRPGVALLAPGTGDWGQGEWDWGLGHHRGCAGERTGSEDSRLFSGSVKWEESAGERAPGRGR